MRKFFIIILFSFLGLYDLPALQTGRIIEQYSITDTERFHKISIPDNDEYILHITDDDKIDIKVNKILDFGGHPPRPVLVETLKTYMGIVYKIKNKTLTLATYGEWLYKEGGAYIILEISIPKNIEIERKKELFGNNSLAVPDTMYMYDNKEGYWYNHTKPAEGWSHIKNIKSKRYYIVPSFLIFLLFLFFIVRKKINTFIFG